MSNVRVDLALHYIEFAIHLRQTLRRFDEDETVHSVGDMLGNHWRRAMVDVEAWNQRFPRHRFFPAGLDLERGGTAARAGCGMKIDRMYHRAVVGILQVNVNRVADAYANERTGHLSVEGPVAEGCALRKSSFHLRR